MGFDCLTKLVDFLCPNHTLEDVEFIEENINQIQTELEKVEKLNVFKSLEELHFTNQNSVEPLLINIEVTLQNLLSTWKNSYNKISFQQAQDVKSLYKSIELKGAIYLTDSIINNAESEILTFKYLYFDQPRQSAKERNPTTSATEEKGKKDKRCLFHSLQIAIAVKMVHEKTGLFPKTISKTNTEGKKKFLKDIEEKFSIENVPTEQLFRNYASLRLSKEYLQNLDEPHKEGVKKILELGGYTELLKGIK